MSASKLEDIVAPRPAGRYGRYYNWVQTLAGRIEVRNATLEVVQYVSKFCSSAVPSE
jgi:hypothetical protein